jgi:hypothetical protein
MTAPLIQAGPEAVPPAATARTRRTARGWGVLLILGWVGQAALRAWFSRGQAVPLANPDETAYLITARIRARPGRGLLRRHLVPGRVSAADQPGVLVHR